MTVEFPYLITNRISAPLDLLGEESDEWQGRTQWPKRGKTGKEVRQGEGRSAERTGVNCASSFLPTPLLLVFEMFFVLFFFLSQLEKKAIPPLEIGRCLLVGS